MPQVKIFAGTASKYFAEKVAAAYGTPLGDATLYKFSDGEMAPNYNESIRGLVITTDRQKVISSEVGAIRLWNLATPAFDVSPADHGGDTLSLTPDGRYQVVQASDGTVACRDEVTHESVTLDGLIAPWGSPNISPDGSWVIYQEADGRRKIWDTSTGTHVVSLIDSYRAPAITCDSRVVYLRSRAADGAGPWTLPLKPHLRLEAARPVRFENIDPADIFALAVVPGSARVIIVALSGAFSWHLDEPAPRRVVARDDWWFRREGSSSGLHGALASERWLFAWSWEQGEVWDMRSARKVLDLDFDPSDSAAAFTQSGRGLLVASGRVVTLWDIERGLAVARFHADAAVHAVACPSDTSFIAVSSDWRVHRLDLRAASGPMPYNPLED